LEGRLALPTNKKNKKTKVVVGEEEGLTFLVIFIIIRSMSIMCYVVCMYGIPVPVERKEGI
jgi:hypothetical protein